MRITLTSTCMYLCTHPTSTSRARVTACTYTSRSFFFSFFFLLSYSTVPFFTSFPLHLTPLAFLFLFLPPSLACGIENEKQKIPTNRIRTTSKATERETQRYRAALLSFSLPFSSLSGAWPEESQAEKGGGFSVQVLSVS